MSSSAERKITEIRSYNRQTIVEEASKKQIKALKSNSQMDEGPAVRTVHEQVQLESIKV